MTPNDQNNGIRLNIDESLYAPKSKKKLVITLSIIFLVIAVTLLYVYGRSNGWGADDSVVSGNITVIDRDHGFDQIGKVEIDVDNTIAETKEKDHGISRPDPDHSSDYITVIMPKDSYKSGELILINSEYKYDAEADRNLDSELRAIAFYQNGSYHTVSTEDLLRADTINALNMMFADFAAETRLSGYVIGADYAYCTAEEQQAWYGNTVAYRGAAEADHYEFRGGESEHETGRAFDLRVLVGSRNILIKNADITYRWIYDNAYKYGFIYRYPDEKSLYTGVSLNEASEHQDHFRYVGVAAATAMYQNDWCLEEFLSIVKRHLSPDDSLTVRCENSKTYSMYFVPCNMYGETEIVIPSGVRYSVSGDNMAGFIVTLELK